MLIERNKENNIIKINFPCRDIFSYTLGWLLPKRKEMMAGYAKNGDLLHSGNVD
jgi:hypothetical protein